MGRRPSKIVAVFFFFWHPGSNFPGGLAAARHKYITGLVLRWTRKIHSYIFTHPEKKFYKELKWEICHKFGVVIRNEAVYLKSETHIRCGCEGSIFSENSSLSPTLRTRGYNKVAPQNLLYLPACWAVAR